MRRALELLLLLAATGCVTFLVPSPCDESLCGGYACDEAGFCLDFCTRDGDCSDGLICDNAGDCVGACEDEDCPGFLTCDYGGYECLDECDSDYDCRRDRVCRRGDCVQQDD